MELAAIKRLARSRKNWDPRIVDKLYDIYKLKNSFGMKIRDPEYKFENNEIVFVKDKYSNILNGHPNHLAAFKTSYPDLNNRDFQWTVVSTDTDADGIIKCFIQPFRAPILPNDTQANYRLKIRQEYLTKQEDQTSLAMPQQT